MSGDDLGHEKGADVSGRFDSGVVHPNMPDDTSLLKPDYWVPSPNFEARRGDGLINLLLLHYTATPTTAYALELLTSKAAQVSSHYLIDGEGGIYQLVGERFRAWHAGEAFWAGEQDINSCSIGIEIQNQGAALARVPAYGRAQMDAVEALCCDIVKRYKIPAHRVLAHSDVAPHRKQDPGAHFDWRRLAAKGVGLFFELDLALADEFVLFDEDGLKNFQRQLQDYGYGLDVTGHMDKRTELVVSAFQRHYRPRSVTGCIDRETIDLLACVLEAMRGWEDNKA